MEWNFATLGHDHLLMGVNNDPVLEITWTRKPFQGSLETQMERFSSSVEKRLGIKVSPFSIHLNSVKPDSKMTLAGFSWESVSSRGKGFLIRCSQCQQISMLRFFASSKTMTDSLMELVVLSYDDSCGEKGIHWKLFGLNLSTPEGFSLITYSFRPGSFMMDFKARGERLTVYSWGPASFLLLKYGAQKDGSGKDGLEKERLEKFARKRLVIPHAMPLSGECSQGSFLVWEWRRFPWFFGFIQRHERLRIILNRKENRIIGLKHVSRSRDEWKIMEGLMG